MHAATFENTAAITSQREEVVTVCPSPGVGLSPTRNATQLFQNAGKELGVPAKPGLSAQV